MAVERAKHSESGTFPVLSSVDLNGSGSGAHGARPTVVRLEGARRSWHLPDGPIPMLVFQRRTGAIVAANAAAHEAYGYSDCELLDCSMDELCGRKQGALRFATSIGRSVQWSGPWTQRRRNGTKFEADIGMIASGDGYVTALLSPRHAEPHRPAADAHSALEAPALRPLAKTLLGPAVSVATDAPRIRELQDRLSIVKTIAEQLEPRSDEPARERIQALKSSVLNAIDGHGSERSAPPEPEPYQLVEPASLVAGVVDSFRARAGAKHVDIMVHCAPRSVRVRPTAFAKVLAELLDNALEASYRGHPILIDVRQTGDGDVLWQVHDVGVGMSERVLSELGEPLRATWRTGLGLGVLAARSIVEEHGGLLRFESAVGVGTTATIWLPGVDAAATTAHA